jgi:hypothetical protein
VCIVSDLTLYPSTFISTIGGYANFTCINHGELISPQSVHLTINSKRADSYEFLTEMTIISENDEFLLMLMNLTAQFNESIIRCRSLMLISDGATILLQGMHHKYP